MIPYLFHASILLAGTFIFYWLLLKNETFFHLNRLILLGSVALSLLLPLLTVPGEWSIHEPEITIFEKSETPTTGYTSENIKSDPHVLADAEIQSEANIHNEERANQSSLGTFTQKIESGKLLWLIYLSGAFIFLVAFILQLVFLLYQILRYPSYRDGAYRIVELDGNIAPYSFFNSIFINPSNYEKATYDQIITHEKIHIDQVHFVDKIIAEGLVIAFWFNPFVWLYRKAITNNLEYLTDNSMIELGIEKSSYQLNLLRVAVPHYPLNITTNYNQSFLKNRIAMMNSRKSSAAASWKYFFILPILGLSVISLNAVKGQVQYVTKEEPKVIVDTQPMIEEEVQNQNQNLGETTSSKKVQVSSPIESQYWNHLDPGEWEGKIKGNEYCLTLNNSNKDHGWQSHHSTCLPMSAFKNQGDTKVMTRAAGTLELKGSWQGNEGRGTFSFTPDAGFLSYLKGEGTELTHDELAFNLFMTDINKDYIAFLKKSGFEVDGKGVVMLAVHDIDQKELKEFMGVFESLDNKDYNLSDLVQFKIHDVTPAYVNELRGLGLDLNTSNVVQAKIHDVEPSYIKAMMNYGLKEADMKDMIQFAIHDVEIDYLEKMKALGFTDMSTQEIVQLNIHDVDPEYVKDFKGMGFDDMRIQDLVQFAIHDIDPNYIKSFQDAGLQDLSRQDIVQAGIHDVDVGYISEMRKAGFKDVNMQDMVQFAIHDVDVDYIRGLKNAGLNDLSKQEIVQAKIHDVEPEYIQEFRSIGLGDLSMQDIIQFAIHDIDPGFVKDFESAGFDDLSKQQIVQAGIHDVNASYIKEMRALDIEIENFHDIIQAKIHDVDTAFIKQAKEKGYSPKTLKEYIRLKISGI